jgi:hypothetical protein
MNEANFASSGVWQSSKTTDDSWALFRVQRRGSEERWQGTVNFPARARKTAAGYVSDTLLVDVAAALLVVVVVHHHPQAKLTIQYFRRLWFYSRQ